MQTHPIMLYRSNGNSPKIGELHQLADGRCRIAIRGFAPVTAAGLLAAAHIIRGLEPSAYIDHTGSDAA